MPFSNIRNHGFLGKWLIPWLGQEKYKVSLKYLEVPENKEVFRKLWRHVCQKDTGANLRGFPMATSTAILAIKEIMPVMYYYHKIKYISMGAY